MIEERSKVVTEYIVEICDTKYVFYNIYSAQYFEKNALKQLEEYSALSVTAKKRLLRYMKLEGICNEYLGDSDDLLSLNIKQLIMRVQYIRISDFEKIQYMVMINDDMCILCKDFVDYKSQCLQQFTDDESGKTYWPEIFSITDLDSGKEVSVEKFKETGE